MNHNRLDQLADGIFAIVMTILVFDIKVPAIWGPVDNFGLWLEIKKLFPLLLSYILSFSLLFTYWRAHHFFVSIYAKNVDSMLTNINALFFMLISLIPFSASILPACRGPSRCSHTTARAAPPSICATAPNPSLVEG